MALVSPGLSITINDQSQYVNSNVGSVPLVLLATAQNKYYNGSLASGTTQASAGTLLSFTSQRDLINQMGTPNFEISATGTAVVGSEISEYGLLTAYSALGMSNQLYAIRADIDLNQLVGTSVRPSAAPANGTEWLDLSTTTWGINQFNSTTQSFSPQAPLLITDPTQVYDDPSYAYSVPTPKTIVGSVGSYALVLVDVDGTAPLEIRLFYKAGANSIGLNNSWVQVGSANWQKSVPVVTGTTTNPVITANSTLTINTITITTSSTTTVSALASSINAANISGVYALATSSGNLQLFVTSAATSNGSVADGKIIITDGTYTPLANCGIRAGTYYSPSFYYGTYAQAPTWLSTDTTPRPTGSVWWMTSAIGGGLNLSYSQYNTTSATFNNIAVPVYANFNSALYSLDPVGGGINIPLGQTIAVYNVYDTTSNTLRILTATSTGIATATGGTPGTFAIGNSFSVASSVPGSTVNISTTVTLTGTTATDFVNDILSANIPYVTAKLNSNGTITITHTAGGFIRLADLSGTPVETAGFSATSGGTGYQVSLATGLVYINNFTNESSYINYSASQPYTKPSTGTYWYYSNPADIDIMVNDGTGWKGYRNVTLDVRGYNLSSTDVNGVIVSATQPVSQSTGSALAAGDLWLNSSDLANFPSLYRYNGTKWVAIDNTDHITSNGIIFADARWDTTGTTDVVTGSLPSISTLLTSNYLDLDAPDYRLYPRGTLLFNTRRSGYNVKKFVSDYFNSTSFPVPSTTPGTPSAIPTVTDAWVTASGLDANGVMHAGGQAQRALVVAAMQSAVDSNLDVLSHVYQFNLICAPNYPELIPNMLTLNDNRGDTAFVIGDTPMDLAPNTTALTNWVNNTSGNGLPSSASASPYLAVYYPAGQTNDLAGNTVVVPASHAVLRTFLYSDQVSHPWFAPAGVNRGLVSNLNSIGYIDTVTGQFVSNSISQGLRDSLFTLNINPITHLPGVGLVVYGQLTRLGSSTARDRVNVVRLENYLRTIFNSISNSYLFEPNDAITRKSIATQIEGSLNNILAQRGLYDFLVICDTSNNTPATIANNQLYVDVAIEPMKDVEFIYIPIAIYNPGTIATLNTQST